MKKVIKIIVLINILLVACFQQQDETVINDVNELKDIPSDGYIIKLKYSGYKNAEKFWDLFAEIAKLYEKKDYALGESVTIHFYNEGKITSRLTSDIGYANMKNDDLEARENVVVKSENRTVLYTEKLSWNNKKEKIYSDTYVKVVKPNSTLTGIGMESDANLEKVEIKSNIRLIRY